MVHPVRGCCQLAETGAGAWHSAHHRRNHGAVQTPYRKDPALTRRFQVLQVAEPEEVAAVEMVRGLVTTLEEHHDVLILDEAVRAAVQLSHRYIPARQLPDKAISLLDTAAARVALSLHTPPARVQYLRQQLNAAELEQELLLKQEKMGIRSERGDVLTARIISLNADLSDTEARWQQELELVRSLQEQRGAARRARRNHSTTGRNGIKRLAG